MTLWAFVTADRSENQSVKCLFFLNWVKVLFAYIFKVQVKPSHPSFFVSPK